MLIGKPSFENITKEGTLEEALFRDFHDVKNEISGMLALVQLTNDAIFYGLQSGKIQEWGQIADHLVELRDNIDKATDRIKEMFDY